MVFEIGQQITLPKNSEQVIVVEIYAYSMLVRQLTNGEQKEFEVTIPDLRVLI